MRTAAALLAAVTALACAVPALGDADPPSDYLFLQDVYYPYNPKVSPGLQASLDELTSRTRKAGFRLRVAIIGSPSDLGAVPQFWGKPQEYAKFLHSEIRNPGSATPLLTVMPQGYGTVETGPRGEAIVNSLPQPVAGADGEASGAIAAVEKLAQANGVDVQTGDLNQAKPKSSGGGSSPIAFLVPIGVLIVAGLVAAAVGRRRRPAE